MLSISHWLFITPVAFVSALLPFLRGDETAYGHAKYVHHLFHCLLHCLCFTPVDCLCECTASRYFALRAVPVFNVE
jgi:hypothetical protein